MPTICHSKHLQTITHTKYIYLKNLEALVHLFTKGAVHVQFFKCLLCRFLSYILYIHNSERSNHFENSFKKMFIQQIPLKWFINARKSWLQVPTEAKIPSCSLWERRIHVAVKPDLSFCVNTSKSVFHHFCCCRPKPSFQILDIGPTPHYRWRLRSQSQVPVQRVLCSRREYTPPSPWSFPHQRIRSLWQLLPGSPRNEAALTTELNSTDTVFVSTPRDEMSVSDSESSTVALEMSLAYCWRAGERGGWLEEREGVRWGHCEGG